MTSIRSFIKKMLQKEGYITVVSGLPRSGTSMMMSALQAGGLPLLIDGRRKADLNNPKGYFEYEPVKKLAKGQTGWVVSAHGKGVKVISALLSYLPDDFRYRVIFMERDIGEILASQRSMLEREGINAQQPISEDTLKKEYQEHLEAVKDWLNSEDWIETLIISYNQALLDPFKVFRAVDDFLEPNLDVEAMAQVVDPSLYREQNQAGK